MSTACSLSNITIEHVLKSLRRCPRWRHRQWCCAFASTSSNGLDVKVSKYWRYRTVGVRYPKYRSIAIPLSTGIKLLQVLRYFDISNIEPALIKWNWCFKMFFFIKPAHVSYWSGSCGCPHVHMHTWICMHACLYMNAIMQSCIYVNMWYNENQ